MTYEKTKKEFQEKGYAFLDDFVEPEDAKRISLEIQKGIFVLGANPEDHMVKHSPSISHLEVTDRLLEFLKPYVEQYTGLDLLPTYAYSRIYKKGDELRPHIDRPACEISVTLTLDYNGDPWDIFIADPAEENNADKIVDGYKDLKHAVKNIKSFKMKQGQGIVYRGMEKVHWREEYNCGEWQAQVFLHYVDADGEHADQIYDRREGLRHHIPRELSKFYILNPVTPPYSSMEEFMQNLTTIHGQMIEFASSVNDVTYGFAINDFSQAKLMTVPCNTRRSGDLYVKDNKQEKYNVIMTLEKTKFKFGTEEKDIFDTNEGTILVIPSFIDYEFEGEDGASVVVVVTEVFGPPFK